VAGTLASMLVRIRGDYDPSGVRQAQSDVNTLANGIARAGQAASLLSSRFRNLTIGAAAGVGGAAKVFADVEKSEISLMRVTGLQGSAFRRLAGDVRALAPSLGLTETAAINLATEAARLGVEGKDLIQFMRTSAQASIALGTDLDDTATTLAHLRASFGLTGKDLNSLTGSIIALDQASAASFPELLRAMTSVGPIARIVGVSATQLAALSATVIETGISAETTGTALAQIFQAINRRSEKLAPLLGMTGESLRRAFQRDQLGVIRQIAQAFVYLNKTGQDTAPFLEAIGLDGRRATAVLGTLGERMDRVNTLLGQANGEFGRGTLLEKAFGAQAQALAFRFQVFKVEFLAAARAIGERLAPVILALLDGLTKLFQVIKNSPLLQFIIGFGLLGVAITAAAGFLVFFTASQVIAFRVARQGLPLITAEYGKLRNAILGVAAAQETANAGGILGGPKRLVGGIAGFFAGRSAAGRTAAMEALTGGAGRAGILTSYLGGFTGISRVLPAIMSGLGTIGQLAARAFWPITIAIGVFMALKDNIFGARTALVRMLEPFKQLFGGEARNTMKNIVGIVEGLAKILGGVFGAIIRIAAEILTPVIKVMAFLVDKIFWAINLVLGPIKWVLEKLGILKGDSDFQVNDGIAKSGASLTVGSPSTSQVQPVAVAAGSSITKTWAPTIILQNTQVRSQDDVSAVERAVHRALQKAAAEAP